MNETIIHERECLLNRLVEIQTELNRIEAAKIASVTKPKPAPEINQVWTSKDRPTVKFVIRNEAQVMAICNSIAAFDFVCDKPHEDGDFSYLCGWQYCRCSD